MKDDPVFSKGVEWLLIIGMLLILFAPLAGKISGWPQEADLMENRHLAQPPAFRETAWDNLSRAIDAWWNDRFAFRTQLIPLRELIWLDLLSAPGKQHVRGKDGHLFLNLMKGDKFQGGQNATVLDYLGEHHLTEAQLSNWADYLEGKNAWLQAYGIRYLFVIAPNKITVQERYLPNSIRKSKGISYIQQLREKAFPRLTPDVDVLDLTQTLIAKENETGTPMFSRTGDVTHWNGIGFYEALLTMDKHLRRHFPGMPPFPVEKLDLRKSATDPTAFSCAWADDPTVHAAEETIIAFRSGDWSDSKCSRAEGRSGNLVLFSDSSWKCFCGGLESFSPGTHTAFPYQWGQHRHAGIYYVTFDELRRMVQEEVPDVVVEAQTERALIIPPGIGIPDEFRLAARFARGNPIFLLTVTDVNTLFGTHIDGLSIEGNGIVINATDCDPALGKATAILTPEDSESVLLVDMDAPDKGIFQVFWSGTEDFYEADSLKAPLEAGRNVLFLPLPLPSDRELRLRIDPGNVAGKYRIRRIEIRAISP